MSPKSYAVIGLGFGDEGKGTTVEYLTRQYGAKTVVRFNGGPQAAHHVVQSNGDWHCFAQFGSGTMVSGTKTHLSRFMAVDPISLMIENEVLKKKGIADGLDRLSVDRECLLVTPFHKYANRAREVARGDDRHGSCGMGVGEAVSEASELGDRALRVGDLENESVLRSKLKDLQQRKLLQVERLECDDPAFVDLKSRLADGGAVDWLMDQYDRFLRLMRRATLPCGSTNVDGDQSIIYEGAQGVLLDRDCGFHPHVTKTPTTFRNALALVRERDDAKPIRVGVLRAYHTRHGAGPFVTEDTGLTSRIPDRHNGTNPWQSDFRVGWFDGVMARYAMEVVGGVDQLLITNLDRLERLPEIQVCTSYLYEGPSEDLDEFFEWSREGNRVVISRIRVLDRPTRDHQARLTQWLSRCRPVYRTIRGFDSVREGNEWSSGAREYLRVLQELMQQQIDLVSVGPTSGDKMSLDVSQ